ncbi:uncharacterized protein LOC133906738 [Phragmites australis]|uniref:uncharacterized protein LOC133906738 n=1 Tax=Phragmites australis TaxID=29695 RepID=UPI002D77AC6E|nr:uncharacterized protein LOC133906738 [Phragmites australis]
MAGSSSTGFPWTPATIAIALNASLQVVREGNDDPLKENNIIQAVAKLHARPICSRLTAPLQCVTTEDLRALLYHRRQMYLRVRELADHPSVIGFSRRQRTIVMSPDQYASHIQAFPEDEQLMNKEISHFLTMCMLFGGGVMPGSRRRRRQSANQRGTEATSTNHPDNDEDKDDDDFMPPMPRRSNRNTGESSRNTARGRSRTTSRCHTTDREIGRGTTSEKPQDDDDDDDFMPQRPRPLRLPSPEDTDDPENDDGFARTHFYNFLEPPRRRQPSYPDSFDHRTWNSYANLRRHFPSP